VEHGEAGAAARRESERSAGAAERLRVKADKAMQRADNFAAGAAGEAAVAAAIAPLSAEGWNLLHDRVMPSGGNIDHVVVGPGSVIVLDAKAWNGRLEVRNDRLYNGAWSQARALEKLAAQRDAVRMALSGLIGVDDPVDMALVITTQPDFGPERVGDALVLGIDHLLDGIRSSRSSYSAHEVESMTSRLMAELPVMGEAPPKAGGLQQVDGVEVGQLFERANRFLYIKQWKGRRVYIRDEDGEQYGYRDLKDGSIHLDHAGDVLVEAVLAASTAKGVDRETLRVPKLPIKVPGGRLLSLFGKVNTTVIVGSLWLSGERRCLYGTLANPTEGTFDLGHVDLATGRLCPASSGPLSRDRGPAERYLALLRDRHPFDQQS
jgi:hypothetical protein